MNSHQTLKSLGAHQAHGDFGAFVFVFVFGQHVAHEPETERELAFDDHARAAPKHKHNCRHMKRGRADDRKATQEVMDGIDRDYATNLLEKDGIVCRPDGGVQLKFRKRYFLSKSTLDDLRTRFEKLCEGFLRLRCEEDRIVLSLERAYPEACQERRAKRESTNPYWKYLDLDQENTKENPAILAKEIWSNELAHLGERFGPKSVITVDVEKQRLRIYEKQIKI
jgi:hypothetical protein